MAQNKKRKVEAQGLGTSLAAEPQPAQQRAKQQQSTGTHQRAGGAAGAAAAGAAVRTAAAPRGASAPAPQQNGSHKTVRVEMVIMPSPVRGPMRGKRSTAASPAAAPAPGARRPQLGVAAAAAALERAAAPQRHTQPPVAVARPAAAARPAGAARPAAAAAAVADTRPAAAAVARPQAVAAPAARAAAAQAAQAAAPAGGQVAAAVAAGTGAQQPPAAAPQADGAAQQQRQRSSCGGSGGAGKRRKKRKTLTAKGKKAAVLGVLAEVELHRAAEAAGAAAAAAVAAGAAAAAAVAVAAPQQQQAQQAAQQPQQVQQVQQQQRQVDPAATANLGKAWQKADISKLARLAEDRAFLLQAIPEHPPEGELDWELIARHFGRYSRGGAAVRQQYYSVVRLMKEARHEGKRGTSYVDLVQRALSSLPDRRGTVYEIQAVLKRDCASCLDKYQTPKGVRWKLAVSEVLRDQPALFEAAGKTATNKIVWRLREAPAAG